mgnify:FL=1
MKVQKLKNQNGITLVALVITTIILLVLAGITVVALSGENGLFSKTKQAREKYSISEAKEKLTTKLMQLQTEVTDEEQRSATIEDINKLVDENSKYYDKEIEGVKDRNENKLVKISGYYFEVDGQLNIVGNIDASELVVTETTYKVNSTNENIMNVTVNIKNEIGIQKVIKPDNNEVTPVGSKEQIAIDYDIEDGKEYKFKVQLIGSNEQKEYTLKANLNAKPEIEQNESNAYPTLTEYGFEINKIVKIDYGENSDNYYSLDNGNSWIRYTEDGVSVKKEGKILAKSVMNGEITKESQENITMQLASDAISKEWYDGDENTYASIGRFERKKYLLVDESAIGKKIKMKVSSSPIYMYITNKTGDEIIFKNIDGEIIPEGAVKIEIYNPTSVGMNIYEMGINTDAEIECDEVYPMITDKNIEQAYYKINVKYYSTAVKKLYKINENGEWKNYTGEIKLNIGDTIYSKGIDKYENENSTGSYKADINNSVPKEWIDENESTSAGLRRFTRNKFLLVDESAIGKKIKMKANDSTIWMYVTNKSGEETLFKNINGETIPEGTVKIEIYNPQSMGVVIYEIGIEN